MSRQPRHVPCLLSAFPNLRYISHETTSLGGFLNRPSGFVPSLSDLISRGGGLPSTCTAPLGLAWRSYLTDGPVVGGIWLFRSFPRLCLYAACSANHLDAPWGPVPRARVLHRAAWRGGCLSTLSPKNRGALLVILRLLRRVETDIILYQDAPSSLSFRVSCAPRRVLRLRAGSRSRRHLLPPPRHIVLMVRPASHPLCVSCLVSLPSLAACCLPSSSAPSPFSFLVPWGSASPLPTGILLDVSGSLPRAPTCRCATA